MNINIRDGRTDREKLLELIRLSEQTHVEFKASVDLRTKRGKAIFVKDLVALANRHPGGYMVIGVDDGGKPCQVKGELGDLSLYDGSRISDLIRLYVEASVQVISQAHEIENNEVILILVKSPESGLPVPFSKLAQFPKESGKSMDTIFREGDIVVRESAQVVPIRWAHWEEILKHRDQQIRDQARAATDEMLKEFIAEFRTSKRAGASPVLIHTGLAPDQFAEAVSAHFESRSPASLARIILKVASRLADPETFEAGLQQMSVLAVNALLFEDYDVYSKVIDKLFEVYKAHHMRDEASLIRYVSYIYAIGSCAIRLERWGGIRGLVSRPIETAPHYTVPSWIRHAQVAGSRNNLFAHHSLMISDARHLLTTVPGLAPDLENIEPVPADELPSNDILANSLCQLDLLYCVIIGVDARYQGQGYPASAAFDGKRALPIIAKLMTDDDMWGTLFPGKTREDSTQAILDVLNLASRETQYFNGWWHTPQDAAELLSYRTGA